MQYHVTPYFLEPECVGHAPRRSRKPRVPSFLFASRRASRPSLGRARLAGASERRGGVQVRERERAP